MSPECVLLTDRAEYRDAVLASAATLEVGVAHVRSGDEAARLWRSPGPMFVGVDRAAELAALGLPPRAGVHLLAAEDELAEAARWSDAIAAPVLPIPDGVRRLSALLSQQDATSLAPMVLVCGASGGLGCSSLAAGLARAAVQDGTDATGAAARALLIDLDPSGGGADLALGVEGRPGWRWDDLAGARGDIGSLVDDLPGIDGVDVLSFGRGKASAPPSAALAAVSTAGRRYYRLVVLDVGRGQLDLAEGLPGVRIAVVGARVRSLAAARPLLEELNVSGHPVRIVLRRGREFALAPVAAERALGVRLDAEVAGERRMAALAEQGAPPWAGASRRWLRGCRQLWRGLS